MDKQWKRLAFLPYEVSSEGEIRSLERVIEAGNGATRLQPSAILKPLDHRGYKRVHLAGDTQYYRFVHRLVAEEFLPREEGKDFVDHLDGNKSNNSVDNLQWVTHATNVNNHHDKYHRAAKSFNFCYGHRVWSQLLNAKYSLDSCHACRHLHGHEGLVRVIMRSEELVDGMVTDFKHLNWFKAFLDDVLDHKFIIDINDPLFGQIVGLDVKLNQVEYYGASFETVDLSSYEGPLVEYYESFVIVDFVPTSENLSSWLLDVVRAYMKPLNIEIERVELFETPKSQAVSVLRLS